MAWARIDDNFFNHPKVRKAGKDAVIFHVAALCHSNAFTTDGFIADDMLQLIATQAFHKRADGYADRLVECELWERVEGGYLIHDFLKYNHSKTEVEEIRTKKSISGKQGGRPIKAEEKQIESKPKANNEAKEKVIESHTQPIPIPSQKQLKDSTAAAAFSGKNIDIYVLFQAIAPVTPQVQKAIDSAVNVYSAGWVRDAIQEGVTHQAETFSYVNKVLTTWKANGRNGSGNGKKPVKIDYGSYEAWTNGGKK